MIEQYQKIEWNYFRRTKNEDKCNTNRMRYITTYSMEANEREKIIHKHWAILHMDPILSTIYLKKPQFEYRHSYNLRDRIAPSMLPDKKKFRPIGCGL
ncbi:hypothetical protein XELAEV_18031401mg [Xenopus laevis]|uniref:Uncharacterized protein n=1 Tax=Xenopus laevis TaxID=8355 RepID=A0A974HFR1_XENLA|nr:hypothetical protein XELAEV_18031401mg [Xenopus laevis]